MTYPDNQEMWPKMNADDAQALWNDYFKRIRCRRLAEAELLIAAAVDAGLDDDTNTYLDYRHFSSVATSIQKLSTHLREDDIVSLSRDAGTDYWFLDGTMRPLTMKVTAEGLIEWGEFMADVSRGYGCVFSWWTLSEADSDRQWSSKAFETDTDWCHVTPQTLTSPDADGGLDEC